MTRWGTPLDGVTRVLSVAYSTLRVGLEDPGSWGEVSHVVERGEIKNERSIWSSLWGKSFAREASVIVIPTGG